MLFYEIVCIWITSFSRKDIGFGRAAVFLWHSLIGFLENRTILREIKIVCLFAHFTPVEKIGMITIVMIPTWNLCVKSVRGNLLLHHLQQRQFWNLKKVRKVKTFTNCNFKWLLIFPECPSGWIDGGKRGCYYVAKEASTMDYATAKAYCKSLDKSAHLAEIRTQQIQKFVEDMKDLKSHNDWWLGGSDRLKVWNIFKVIFSHSFQLKNLCVPGRTLDLGEQWYTF